MKNNINPYKDSNLGKKEQVAQMFNNISGNYDGLNRVISLGLDTSWRKNVLNLVANTKPNQILDIATGTGDLAILLSQTSATKIVGLDISEGMLEVGRKKMKEKGIFPVFVNLEDVFCGGCKVELSLNFIEKLKTQKMLGCEHCGRIIMMK